MIRCNVCKERNTDLYLGHVDESQRQCLVTQDGPVFVPLPPLQHDLELVGVPLQEVRVLQVEKTHVSVQREADWED